MKWPSHIVIVRHGQSTYNQLRSLKEKDGTYRDFIKWFEKNPNDRYTRILAEEVRSKFRLKVSDYQTPLSDEGVRQSFTVGGKIATIAPPPDVIFVSPYLRTQQTLKHMIRGGFDIGSAKIVPEDRIREQEHGLSLLYSDWRLFHVFHPEQKQLHDLLGPYWYQYPQGESVSDVRSRIRSFTSTLVREHAGKVVYLISHHLTKLSIRANYERLTPEEFIHLDENEKPINCGVTVYEGNPNMGSNGKLKLVQYNTRLY